METQMSHFGVSLENFVPLVFFNQLEETKTSTGCGELLKKNLFTSLTAVHAVQNVDIATRKDWVIQMLTLPCNKIMYYLEN